MVTEAATLGERCGLDTKQIKEKHFQKILRIRSLVESEEDS